MLQCSYFILRGRCSVNWREGWNVPKLRIMSRVCRKVLEVTYCSFFVHLQQNSSVKNQTHYFFLSHFHRPRCMCIFHAWHGASRVNQFQQPISTSPMSRTNCVCWAPRKYQKKNRMGTYCMSKLVNQHHTYLQVSQDMCMTA